MSERNDPNTALQQIDEIRDAVGERFRDEIVSATFRAAERISKEVVHRSRKRATWDEHIDRFMTHPIWGWPVMVAVLAAVLWITVVGANIPSAFLAGMLMDKGGLTEFFDSFFGTTAPEFMTKSLYELLHMGFAAIQAPTWLSGMLVDCVYLCLAWVV